MQDAIFGPLGLASSTYEPTGALKERAAPGHMAHPYEDEAQPALPSPLNGMAAAGQLWTTARDLARWIAAHCQATGDAASVEAGNLTGGASGSGPGGAPTSGPILKGSSLYEMQQAIYVEPGWVGGYGFGWRINRRGDRVYHGHGGSVPGYRSQIFFDAAQKVGIVLLIDGVGMADAIAAPLLDTAAAHVAAAERARPQTQPSPTPPEYRRFLGLYQMLRVGDTATRVEYRNGKLTLKDAPAGPFPGAPPVTLEPTGESAVFTVRGGRYSGEPLTFSLDGDGAVTGFVASGFTFVRLGERA
jgi:CubicO group peptidase (beta-lactamase class C family)